MLAPLATVTVVALIATLALIVPLRLTDAMVMLRVDGLLPELSTSDKVAPLEIESVPAPLIV
jgi:hypothetical protein